MACLRKLKSLPYSVKKLLQTIGKRQCSGGNNQFKIRRLHAKEAGSLANSQTAEGTRLDHKDLKQLHSLDPEGFFVALDENGDIIGTIGAARLSSSLGFIGFYHVKEDQKGEGVEESLWTAAREHLGDRNVGIDVDSSEAEKCSELGFQEAWRNGRFKGVGVALLPEMQTTKIVRNVTEMPFSKVAYFDEELFGLERMRFLYKWANIETPVGYSYALSEGDNIMGYGVLRHLDESRKHRIAPLYAQNASVAQVLLLALLNNIPQQPVYIDAPLTNPSFTRILTTDLRMEQIAETVRMYTKGDPGIPVQKMFGLLSTDLG